MPEHRALPKEGLVQTERKPDGDDWNGSVVNIYLDAGTRVDAPLQHMEYRRRIDEIPIEDFIYEEPLMLDVPLGKNEFVTVEMLMENSEVEQADLLIFNTGHWKYRDSDIERYSSDFPAVSPEAAEYMRTQLPELKAV